MTSLHHLFLCLFVVVVVAVNSRLGSVYHVQYFGDAPERGYIFEKNMVQFTGEDQYLELSQSNKQPVTSATLRKVIYRRLFCACVNRVVGRLFSTICAFLLAASCVFSCFKSFVVQTAPSVPCKLRAQWNMGLLQAKEALSLSLEKRVENFVFLYDENGSHLNSYILEKLKPERIDKTEETESRLDPVLSSLLVSL